MTSPQRGAERQMALPQLDEPWPSQAVELETEPHALRGLAGLGSTHRGSLDDPACPEELRSSDSSANNELPRVSVLLGAWARGDLAARNQIFDRLYSELKICAARCLRRERESNSLQPTALVHEVYCRLSEAEPISANDRVHFMALAGRAMRHVLVDHARARLAEKRGKGWQRTTINCEDLACNSNIDILDIDRALDKLSEIDPDRARLVELRYFGGYSIEETALALGCSPATVKRSWDLARSYLHFILSAEDASRTTESGQR